MRNESDESVDESVMSDDRTQFCAVYVHETYADIES